MKLVGEFLLANLEGITILVGISILHIERQKQNY